MANQIINEEFRKMQKLAGLLNENEFQSSISEESEEESDFDPYKAAGEIIWKRSGAIHTQGEADRLKNNPEMKKIMDGYASTPEQEAQIIKASDEYFEYLNEFKAFIDKFKNTPLWKVSQGYAMSNKDGEILAATYKAAENNIA